MNKRQAKKRAKKRAEASKRYSSDIYSTGAEVQSAVNRINNRIQTAVRHFGVDSKIVQDMYSQIDVLIPFSNQRYNADGVLQIARPYQLYKDIDMHQIINVMDDENIRTYGDIKAEYQKGYDRFRASDSGFEMSIDDYIDTFSNIMDYLIWASENADTPEGMEILRIAYKKGGHTYEDFARIKALYQQGVSKYD